MSTYRVTDETLDVWARQALIAFIPHIDRVIAAMVTELRERRAAERTHTPTDWDYESHCVHPGCHLPATHRILVGMVEDAPMGDNTPLYEMVCCAHSTTVQEGP